MQIDAGSVAIGAVVGTLWWILYIFYIMDRKISKHIGLLGKGHYDDVIGEISVIAVNRILSDEQLKKVVGGMIHGYAKSFSDQTMGMLKKGAEQYGINLDQVGSAGNVVGQGGFNPNVIIEKLLGSMFGD